MDALRVLYVNDGLSPYLDLLAYEDWKRPKGTVIYRGGLPRLANPGLSDSQLISELAQELLELPTWLPFMG